MGTHQLIPVVDQGLGNHIACARHVELGDLSRAVELPAAPTVVMNGQALAHGR